MSGVLSPQDRVDEFRQDQLFSFARFAEGSFFILISQTKNFCQSMTSISWVRFTSIQKEDFCLEENGIYHSEN